MQNTITITTDQTYQLAACQADVSGFALKVPDTGYTATTYASSNTAIATVSAGGLVTPVAVGTCIITATQTGPNKTPLVGTLAVTVVIPAPNSLALTGTSLP